MSPLYLIGTTTVGRETGLKINFKDIVFCLYLYSNYIQDNQGKIVSENNMRNNRRRWWGAVG
jgi:hypothetical protein